MELKQLFCVGIASLALITPVAAASPDVITPDEIALGTARVLVWLTECEPKNIPAKYAANVGALMFATTPSVGLQASKRAHSVFAQVVRDNGGSKEEVCEALDVMYRPGTHVLDK